MKYSNLLIILLITSCATMKEQEDQIVKRLQRGLSDKKVSAIMGMVPKLNVTTNGNKKLTEYKNFYFFFEDNKLKDWIYTNDKIISVSYDIYSKLNSNEQLKAVLFPDSSSDKNTFFIQENIKLIKMALRRSRIEIVDQDEEHDFKLYYGVSLSAPDVEYRSISTPKYRLNYVPSQTSSFQTSGYYGGSYGSFSGTQTTPGRLESQYAGQETQTFKIEKYTKSLYFKGISKNEEKLFEAKLSLVDKSKDIRFDQKLLLFTTSGLNLRENSSKDYLLPLENTILRGFLGLEIPSTEGTSRSRGIAQELRERMRD